MLAEKDGKIKEKDEKIKELQQELGNYHRRMTTVIPEINAVFYKCEHCKAFYTCIV